MALRLKVEGRVIEPGAAYCMTDAEAARALASKRVVRSAEVVAYVPTRNVVAGYLADGVLRPEQVRAAEEIAAHWHAVTRALHARCGLYAERMPKSVGDLVHPGDAARAARYRVWAEWAGTQAVSVSATLVDVTLDVAVDGLSWHGIRAKRRIGDVRAKRLVQASLWHYARAAGWIEQRDRAA